jgi:threonine dehydratase/serine racemase
MSYATDSSAIQEASRRIAGRAHRTPVVTCSAIDALAGRSVFFKCENLQKVGAFKFRGACNAVLKLTEDHARRGVLTHSSGNHAQALALAALQRGIQAHVVMPSTALSNKRRAVEGYGARVITCEPTLEARETTADAVEKQTGAIFIPPYDHPDIIAGQGTAALELLEDIPALDALIAPVGGGGLLAGTCVAARGINASIRLFAAEPCGADDAAQSLSAGRLILQTAPNTIADGLLTSLGELTWPIIRDHVTGIVTVEDDATVAAMRLFWERAKLLIEPSSAVAIAALLSEEFQAIDGCERVGVILSGGNVDLDHMPW